jgi:hypothetical protein
LSGPVYAPGALRRTGAAAPVWANPGAQSSGDRWIYEVFTPPAISYSAATRTFAVDPLTGPATPAAPWEVDLLGVKLAQFRLQLVGYFGGPGDYVAAFSTHGSTEILLARVGHSFTDLGLSLKDFAVKKILVEPAGPRPVFEVAAQAVLQDERDGSEVILDGRSRKFTATPLAVCQYPDGDSTRTGEFREGETVSLNGTVYRFERIRLDPPEVMVVRQAAGAASAETRILQPVAAQKRAITNHSTRAISSPAQPEAGLTLNRN